MPLFAVEVLEEDVDRRAARLSQAHGVVPREPPGSRRHISLSGSTAQHGASRCLLAIPSRERLVRVLRYVLDENEFLSPFGIRSLSRRPRGASVRVSTATASECRVDYAPGESHDRHVRRQLELARTDLVSAELPADRSAGALPPLLWRRIRPWSVPPDRASCLTLTRWRRRSPGVLASIFLPRRRRGAAPAMAAIHGMRTIRIGAISCSSMNTFTAIPDAASARVIRPAGAPCRCGSSMTGPDQLRSRHHPARSVRLQPDRPLKHRDERRYAPT